MYRKFRQKAIWIALAVNLAVLALFINIVSIPLLAPATGVETAERMPEFSWGGLQGSFTFMIDEDPDFGSPRTSHVSGNSYTPEEPLEFDTYYWKVVSEGMSSATGMVNVVSEVSVERGEGWMRNTGNAPIFLKREVPPTSNATETVSGITGMVVGVNETVKVGRKENVTAEQA